MNFPFYFPCNEKVGTNKLIRMYILICTYNKWYNKTITIKLKLPLEGKHKSQ